jgi:hypothetical protein
MAGQCGGERLAQEQRHVAPGKSETAANVAADAAGTRHDDGRVGRKRGSGGLGALPAIDL